MDGGASPVVGPTPDPQTGSPVTPMSDFSKPDPAHGTKLSSGTLVGEYQIQSKIGEGGMGTVYAAIHPIIGKKVAIKVLAGRLAKNKNAIRRFVLEARAVNDIRHPGLVDIFSFGRLTDGRHYYVMEFLDGRDLGDVLRERNSLPVVEAIPIFSEVGHALVAVHSKGIVHRDLKPENILLLTTSLPGGQRVKLVDFGLAKLVEGVPAHMQDSAPRTAAGVNVGTPHYMSPEQCRGLKVDARADLYALGVLLYESLTGKLPFDGATALDIWQAHAEKAPRPPIELAPGVVTPALNALILRLLAKQPEHRIQTAADFCIALEDLSEDGRAKSTPQPFRVGGAYDDISSTIEDLPAIPAFEVVSTEEDRRREIEELRANLGLHIEEPAAVGESDAQMSALVINLGPARVAAIDQKSSHRGESHSLQLPVKGAKHRYSSRPIEERKHVPRLAAPITRGGQPQPADPPARPRAGVGRILRVVLVVALLAAAIVVAIKFVK